MIGNGRTRSEFLTLLRKLKRTNSYNALEELTGVNRLYLWNMLCVPGYEPPDWVWRKLGTVKVRRPRRIAVRVDDAESAAGSILRNFERERVVELIGFLEEELTADERR